MILVKTIYIILVVVRGPFSVDPDELQRNIATAQASLREAGVDMRVARTVYIKDPHPRLNSLDDWKPNFRKMQATMIRKGLWDPSKITLMVKGPMLQGGFKWSAGTAQGICMTKGSFAMVNFATYPRWSAAPLTPGSQLIAHEIGHLSGAGHDPSLPATMMYSDGLKNFREDIKFSEYSKNEIMRCKR